MNSDPDSPHPLASFELADLRIDPGANTVSGPGAIVQLEPKVMEVLVALMRRRGETVSTRELIDEVWEGKAVVDAVVSRAISELRRALNDDPKAPRFIQTVSRRGYRLIAPSRTGPASAEQAAAASAATSPPAATRPTAAASRRRYALLAGLLLVLVGAAVGWRALSTRLPGGMPPEAFLLYARARAALAGGSCVAGQTLTDLERVLSLAPTHAPAWEAYGWAKYNRVSSCGESGTGYNEAMHASKRALELAPRLPGALAIQAAVLTETGQAELAYELLAPRLGEAAEIDALAGYALTYCGRLDEAAALVEKVIRRDPSFYSREGWTPNVLLYLGLERRFLEISVQGDSPLSRFYRGFAHYRLGERDQALAQLGPAFAERPADPFARLAEAVVAILEQRYTDARLLLGQLALQRERLEASDGELTFRLAELSAAAGDTERALALLTRAVDQGFFCSRCLESAPALRALPAPALRDILERALEREKRAAYQARGSSS